MTDRELQMLTKGVIAGDFDVREKLPEVAELAVKIVGRDAEGDIKKFLLLLLRSLVNSSARCGSDFGSARIAGQMMAINKLLGLFESIEHFKTCASADEVTGVREQREDFPADGYL